MRLLHDIHFTTGKLPPKELFKAHNISERTGYVTRYRSNSAASQKGRPARREAKEEEGVEDTTAGPLTSSGQAARGRVPRSGKVKPEEAAHRHLDYSNSKRLSTLDTTPRSRSVIKVI